MSRIGKQPIAIPDGVSVSIEASTVTVTGPKGELVREFHPDMEIVENDGMIEITRPSNRSTHRSLHGLTRSLLANMVTGVHVGFRKELEIYGVGYRAELKGQLLQMNLGFSHPILVVPPEGITFEVPEPTKITVSGIDKELVGEITARIRKYRLPEPYKGKGIHYKDEHVRRKAGKAAV